MLFFFRLNSALEANEKFFIKAGIYLILEKLKIITYRNLFKKVALLMKTHQIPIDAFLAAMKMMKVEDIDGDETQCIIANLIYEGKIKGYISHQHQKLVVSKKDAFPPLSMAASWFQHFLFFEQIHFKRILILFKWTTLFSLISFTFGQNLY